MLCVGTDEYALLAESLFGSGKNARSAGATITTLCVITRINREVPITTVTMENLAHLDVGQFAKLTRKFLCRVRNPWNLVTWLPYYLIGDINR